MTMAARPKTAKKTSRFYKDPETGGKFGTFGRRGTAFEGPWLALAEAYGGVTALAEAVGVSYSTLHRWAVRGDKVPQASWRFLATLAVQKGLVPPPQNNENES